MHATSVLDAFTQIPLPYFPVLKAVDFVKVDLPFGTLSTRIGINSPRNRNYIKIDGDARPYRVYNKKYITI